MYKATIIGHFGCGLDYSDGQTVKTKNLSACLCEIFGNDKIKKEDTHGGVKSLLKAPIIVFRAFKQSENIIILPAHRGVKIYAPIISFYMFFFKKTRVHYVVVGGWIYKLVHKNLFLKKSLKKFNYIYTETNILKERLDAEGFQNVCVMPNFKNIKVIDEKNINYNHCEPYEICTFSRVMKEKGIEELIKAVTEINGKYSRNIYKLDIYGPVDENEKKWFNSLKEKFPEYIKYCGVVLPEKSVKTVKNYFALIFPTLFFTEGIPGTIIDAYCSGVPVIASRWESFDDVVKENFTGIGYDFADTDKLIEVLDTIAKYPERVLNLKQNCLQFAKQYSSEEAIKILTEKM